MLRRQPGLRDCLVVAYDSTAGPAPAAVLIADAADEILQSAIDAANRELAPFQQIRYWLRWPQPEFPRTSTGKVLRRAVLSWTQQLLTAGGVAGEGPSDQLIEVLRQLGAPNRRGVLERPVSRGPALGQPCHGATAVEPGNAVWAGARRRGVGGRVRTVGDLRELLRHPGARSGWRPREGRPAGRNLRRLNRMAPRHSYRHSPAQKTERFFPGGPRGRLSAECGSASWRESSGRWCGCCSHPVLHRGLPGTSLAADRQPSHGVRCPGDPLCPEQQ